VHDFRRLGAARELHAGILMFEQAIRRAKIGSSRSAQ
jgi:hypothetical protein